MSESHIPSSREVAAQRNVARRATRPSVVTTAIAVAVIATFVLSSVSYAQILEASPVSAGVAGNDGATARGHVAGLRNPALLSQQRNRAFSLSLPILSGVRASAGTGPVSVGDIRDEVGDPLPLEVRTQWMDRVRAANGFEGDADADAILFGLSFRSVALNIGTVARTSINLPTDAADILLFGDNGESGLPHDMQLAGTRGRGWAVSFGALSLGHALPFKPFGGTLSLGVTGKYVIGHLLADLESDPSGAGSLKLPLIVVGEDANGRSGNGFGVDLGAAWQTERLTIGLTAYDVYNSFHFDVADARIHDAHSDISTGDDTPDVPDEPIGPDSPYRTRARALVDDAVFRPVTRLSAAYLLTPRWTITGDILADGASRNALDSSRGAVGVGTELRYIPVIPLRAGYTKLSGGSRWAVGAGIHLAGFRIDGAYGQRTLNGSSSDEVSLGMSIVSRP